MYVHTGVHKRTTHVYKVVFETELVDATPYCGQALAEWQF